MPVCPACEAENLPDASTCRRCGLASELFEPIRAAVGVPKGDPRYERHIRELMDAIGPLAQPSNGPSERNGDIASPARFPALSAARPPPATTPAPSIRAVPEPPALPPATDLATLRRQADAYFRLAHRLGLDPATLGELGPRIASLESPPELERIGRDLFVRVAAALTESYESEAARRDELTEFAPTGELDEPLASARRSLELGNLDECEAALRRTGDLLDHLEETWGSTQVLLLGARDLAEMIRELRGDPTGALGPIEEGQRLARAGERREAEGLLARGTLGLWTLLNPLIEPDIAARSEEVRLRQAEGADVEPVVSDLQEFAALVGRRNFSAAISAYRWAFDRLARLARSAEPLRAAFNARDPVAPP